MKEIILINISGSDKPGLTSAITGILARHSVNILDIGQAVIHDTLSLGILVEIPKTGEPSPVLKDVLFCAHELGVHTDFTPVGEQSYNQWVGAQGKPRYIITLLARKITPDQISRVTAILARHKLNIHQINRLSGRIPLGSQHSSQKACVEFSLRGEPRDSDLLRRDLFQLTETLEVDFAFQKDSVFRRNCRLVAFDMDSTLIESEVIDELAKAAGVGEQVATVTEQAMRGEIDFKMSLRRRVALLNGLDESVLQAIAMGLKLTEGAEKLISTLTAIGYKTAILSGGFTYFGRFLQKRLDIDYLFANELDIVDGKLTGNLRGQIVDGQRKADLLKEIAKKEHIRLEQVIAVGDGANDLPMLSAAGLGIAFRAKPIVKESAKQSISTLGLDGILYLLGFSDRETFLTQPPSLHK
ncbi:MAG: phosphoserine phosphatase SerB [Desulfobacterales bacterium]|nr:phosphoserine phosphatase SerB [Desulfobacterales bacterium]MDD4072160.1 phosphoserine phosphatase SerB [Desulfobacterales bacterium]MDD4394199.1 phosphoserine phosphatase SerB [Desulfobacterales bacterium]